MCMINRYHSIINVAKILLTSLFINCDVMLYYKYMSLDTTHVTFVKCTTENCSCAVDRNGPCQLYDNGRTYST